MIKKDEKDKVLRKEEVKQLKEYNKKVAKFFDMSLENFEIKIVKKKKLFEISKKHAEWLISKTKGNKIYILPRDEISKDFFETLKHEIVHIYIHKKFPWISGFIAEGLAEYFARPYKKRWQRKLLEENANILQFMAGVKKRYLSAFSLVYFLIKKFGKEKIFLLASKLKPLNKMEKEEINKIFLSLLGMDIHAFEKQWREFIKNES